MIALQTDGALSHIDPSAHEVIATTEPVVQPFTVDYEQTLPSLVVAGGHAYVSDPAANTVTEVHIADALEMEDIFEVEATPGSITVVGTE